MLKMTGRSGEYFLNDTKVYKVEDTLALVCIGIRLSGIFFFVINNLNFVNPGIFLYNLLINFVAAGFLFSSN
jgi:hypothetical protein